MHHQAPQYCSATKVRTYKDARFRELEPENLAWYTERNVLLTPRSFHNNRFMNIWLTYNTLVMSRTINDLAGPPLYMGHPTSYSGTQAYLIRG